jgi:gentisate 1,2-dioxygenase
MTQPKEIHELNGLLEPRWFSGLWNIDHAERPSEPKTRVKPPLWKWQDIYNSLLRAREKISVANGRVERRVIHLVNPGMAETQTTSHSLLMSLVMR